MYSCHFMDQMDKENTLYGICSFCLFVIILAESQNDFAHLESRGCKNLNITHLDLLVFLLIVVKKMQNLKKMATFQDEDGKLDLTWTSTSVRC